MFRSIKDLRGFALRATDGVIGKVDDFYFDDDDWGIRYLVVETGTWLLGRKVLISPMSVGHAGWMARQLPVALTRTQVELSPDIDTRKPVSRQHEAEYSRVLWIPFLLGWRWLMGYGRVSGRPDYPARNRRELESARHFRHAIVGRLPPAQ